MQRREVWAAAAGTALLARMAWAESLPTDLKITRIIGCDLPTRRSKVAGKNAFRIEGIRREAAMARPQGILGIQRVSGPGLERTLRPFRGARIGLGDASGCNMVP
jgi:hypothetical protein